MMTRQREQLALQMRTQQVLTEVEEIMKKDFGVKYFRLKQEDQLRLLRLKQWEEKYAVSLRWMLKQLIPFWREKYSKYSGKVGFGVTISTLVGKVSEEIILGKIWEQFPDGENKLQMKSVSQQYQWTRIWDAPRKESWDDPVEAIRKYQSRMLEERQDRKLWARKLCRRRYRTNPW